MYIYIYIDVCKFVHSYIRISIVYAYMSMHVIYMAPQKRPQVANRSPKRKTLCWRATSALVKGTEKKVLEVGYFGDWNYLRFEMDLFETLPPPSSPGLSCLSLLWPFGWIWGMLMCDGTCCSLKIWPRDCCQPVMCKFAGPSWKLACEASEL